MTCKKTIHIIIKNNNKAKSYTVTTKKFQNIEKPK